MKNLPELKQILELKGLCEGLRADGLVQTDYLSIVKGPRGGEFPIISFTIGPHGPNDKDVPTLGLFGGVHGLERIGTHVILSYLKSLFVQLSWDKELVKNFTDFRLVSIPIINPGGMATYRRSNPQGVDLMRNAPIEADDQTAFLLGGHRFSSKLPWYRGEQGRAMEKESQAVVDFVKEYMFGAKAAVALDIHSGFGMTDRLWYPYAKTKKDFPLKREALLLKELLDKTLPHHVYHVEPQSVSYTTHGDLWDYIFDLHQEYSAGEKRLFLPLTLELGSWSWVRKNPIQIFDALGLFNPIKPHRYDRIMRRHMLLIDFLGRAVKNFQAWTSRK